MFLSHHAPKGPISLPYEESCQQLLLTLYVVDRFKTQIPILSNSLCQPTFLFVLNRSPKRALSNSEELRVKNPSISRRSMVADILPSLQNISTKPVPVGHSKITVDDTLSVNFHFYCRSISRSAKYRRMGPLFRIPSLPKPESEPPEPSVSI